MFRTSVDDVGQGGGEGRPKSKFWLGRL